VAFAQVNDLRNWEAWSPWAKLDPAAKQTYAGPTAGVGASFSSVHRGRARVERPGVCGAGVCAASSRCASARSFSVARSSSADAGADALGFGGSGAGGAAFVIGRATARTMGWPMRATFRMDMRESRGEFTAGWR
jgi:hypothetical protein